jgi:hypothetical protein
VKIPELFFYKVAGDKIVMIRPEVVPAVHRAAYSANRVELPPL